MTTGSLIFIGILQAALIALAAPLFSGFARVLRAKMHSRHGPPLLQNYHDLIKLVKRQEILPAEGRLVFRITPYLTVVCGLAGGDDHPDPGHAIPVRLGGRHDPGDLSAGAHPLLYRRSRVWPPEALLAAWARGASCSISALIEPLILLVLFVMALLAGSTNLGVISTADRHGHTALLRDRLAGDDLFCVCDLCRGGETAL